MDPFGSGNTIGQRSSGYDGSSEMAQVTAIANEADKPPRLYRRGDPLLNLHADHADDWDERLVALTGGDPARQRQHRHAAPTCVCRTA